MSFKNFDKSTRKSDYVAGQIIKEIQSGAYEKGDKLPPETEIAEQIGVSRNSVREAINALRIVGVIETKHGEGSFVSLSEKSLEDTLHNSISLLKKAEYNPFDIMEVRQKVEPALASLALEEVDEETIDQLTTTLEKMREVISKGEPDNCFTIHWNFHTRIIQSVGNPFAKKIFRPIVEVMLEGHKKDTLWWKIIREYHTSRENCTGCLRDHEQILEALRKKDQKLLEQAYNNHFRSVEKRIALGH